MHVIVKDKLEELEFRFNIREKGDMVVVFLHALLHVYSPKPCVDIVENQHGCSKVVVRAMKQYFEIPTYLLISP